MPEAIRDIAEGAASPSGQRAWAEVDLEAIVRNYRALTSWVPPTTRVMAIVKADAYGHGCHAVVDALHRHCGALWFGVATVDEARAVRSACPACRILVLSPILPEEVEPILECKATPVLSDAMLLPVLNRTAASRRSAVDVHVEVDTGMGRSGVLAGHLPDLARQIAASPCIRLEGLMTHFPDAEADAHGTLRQTAALKESQSVVSSILDYAPMLHAANSAGTLLYPETHLDMVRPGMALYGLMPAAPPGQNVPHLEPVLSLRTRVLLVRDLPRGHPISYGSTHILATASRVAVLGIGYADGFRRELSNRATVIIRGRPAPLIGRVCMDMTMVDVTDIPGVVAGDVATLIGRDGTQEIRAVDLARMIGATEHEITTGLSARVPRRLADVC